MPLYEIADLDDAMNALKEEMFQDLSESLLQEKHIPDHSVESFEIN